MHEIVGGVGIAATLVILLHGIYIITKPHKFQI